MSNLPSVTTSFILDQVSNSAVPSPRCSIEPPGAPQSPQISTPNLTRKSRSMKRIQRTKPHNQPRHSVRKKQLNLNFKWTTGRFQHGTYIENDKFFHPLPDEKTALDYFHDFFPEGLFSEICEYTNMYSVQESGRSLNVSIGEMRTFIAIKLFMGIATLPSYLDFWAGDTSYPIVADLMPLKRYQAIRRYIHFVDNTETDTDLYFKIRQFVEQIRQNCLKIEEENRFSIDEMVIPYKGTKAGKKRQYNPRKLRKWGFKNLVRAGASGVIYDFLL
ncbi:hypothetical protein K1T71_011809 [Dendrolimus kikuchii]|uniref:Uncharacterized protein n=1 Tax=Dendrolimus kikuchii TaxID=765133 RepID=A0ACC1CM33_9NEOP|nr:hypothetical protein K1T71_011809 [Dendrolimus kikuchii]